MLSEFSLRNWHNFKLLFVDFFHWEKLFRLNQDRFFGVIQVKKFIVLFHLFVTLEGLELEITEEFFFFAIMDLCLLFFAHHTHF